MFFYNFFKILINTFIIEHLRAAASIGTFTLGGVSTAGRQLCRGRSEKFVVNVAILRVQVSVSEFLDEIRE